MSDLTYTPAPSLTAWTRYLASERAARDAYLTAVAQAHERWLTGPWPDRDMYKQVELHAWYTYYQAGQQAWQQYRRDLETPPPPPPAHQATNPYPASRVPGQDGSRPAPDPSWFHGDAEDGA